MLFKDNQKLTIILISDMLATTTKREIKTTRQIGGRQAYAVRGHRKEYYLIITPHMLVFDGWEIPHKVDTETQQFAGNGLYNFVTKRYGDLKTFLTTKNLNKRFTGWGKIVYQIEQLRGDNAAPVFSPEEIKTLI